MTLHGLKEGEDLQSKYRPLVELGQGGTANVYLGVARGPSGFNKLVVLKALKKTLASDSDFREMFLNEARLAARLNHQNVVQTYEVYEDKGLPVIVMEYLEGQTLANVVASAREGNKLSTPMRLTILNEVLSGLQYAHELVDYDGRPLNVVHRDMTPHNVFISFDGQVKVLDFGIAKLSGSAVETEVGVIKGKIHYMPPEQISGGRVDRRADIFAVGVMLWEAATGQRMWKGMSDAEIMNAVLLAKIPRPRSVRPGVSAELEHICMKALAADPGDRYATAADLQSELEMLLARDASAVTGRDIGKFVGTLFRDLRAKTQQIVEQELGRINSTPYLSGSPIAIAPSSLLSISSATTRGDASTRRYGPPSRRSIFWPAILGVVIGVAFFLWSEARARLRHPASEQGAQTASTTEPLPTATTATKSPEQVKLRITASPANAKLLLDDVPITPNPYSTSLPADGATHTIRAEAAGYEAESQIFASDKDANFTLSLKAADKSGQKTQAQSKRRVQPAISGSAAKAEPNCTPAYIVDDDGIKMFKAECM